jgi:ATP-dependent Clp protease ATP-binding subunit ClpA
MVTEDVRKTLIDNRIITLDLAAMIAEQNTVSEFEELKKVMKEVTDKKCQCIFMETGNASTGLARCSQGRLYGLEIY